MFTSSSMGVSLLSVVIMIGVLGISLTITHNLLYQQTNVNRELETRKEMKEIYEAIMGNPEVGTFGYVSDMGRLPEDLTELADKAGQPDYVGTENSNGIRWGWNGPYINTGRDLESYRKDAWGNDYAIVGVGQIRSNGPDGMVDTLDDIVFPSKPLKSVDGSLILKVPKGGVLCDLSDINEIVVYYGEEGIEESKSLGTNFKLSDEEGFYATDPIPLHHGIHAVEVIDTIGKTVLANVAVFAESTNTQIVGTLPYKGINLHPLFPPHISGSDDNRAIEVDIVNATGCQEDEGVSYNVSRIDFAELGGVEDHHLLEISFNDNVVFTAVTGIPISHDIENPTSITLSEIYHMQPGKSLNKLKFLNAVTPDTSFTLTYRYTDTGEPEISRNSTIRFRLE
ncbi:MAG: hypothetical protein ACUZ77_11125 [Candidatus Brocadiales bacterium]